MPRVVNINQQQRLRDDFYGWMLVEMKKQKITNAEMAETLGMSKQTFNYYKNNMKFTFTQLVLIFNKLNADEERIIKLMKMR